jgi:hypothetical protein
MAHVPHGTSEEITIYGNMTVGTWVMVRDGCPISAEVLGDEVHFLFGETPREGTEFVIEVDPLREFVRLATEAVRESDAAAEAMYGPEED